MRHKAFRNLLGLCIFLLFFSMFSSLLSNAATEDFQEFVYDEGGLVRLVPEAFDSDGDAVSFAYSFPLNSTGEWLTGYDDAGSYDVSISVFDGKSSADYVVKLIINNINQPPNIGVRDIAVYENEYVDARPAVSDPDNDKINLYFSQPLDSNGRWQTGYGDAGNYTVTVTASDGVETVNGSFILTVKSSNKPPRILSAFPSGRLINIAEGDSVDFFIDAKDDEGGHVVYAWRVDGNEEGDGKEFTFAPGYGNSGRHSVSAEASDGSDSVYEEWEVVVDYVNRPPSLDDLAGQYEVNEGDAVILDLPVEDADGDLLAYSIDAPFDINGTWKTGFDDAGAYEMKIEASDGELNASRLVRVVVKNVDRPPELGSIEDHAVYEGDQLKVLLSAGDPDGDPLNFSIGGIEGAYVNDFELLWSPDYDFISLPKNYFSAMIGRLGLSPYTYLRDRSFPVIVALCANGKCTEQVFKVTVKNVNRLPDVSSAIININEGDFVDLKSRLNATDPDGDYLRYSFSSPFSRKGIWQTGYADEGVHTANFTVYDGSGSSESSVEISVGNADRPPSFGVLSDFTVNENSTLSFAVPVNDPDGDNVSIVAEGIPDGSSFSDGIFSWTPDYNVVSNGSSKEDFLITFSAFKGVAGKIAELGYADNMNAITDFNNIGNNTNISGGVIIRKTVIITVKDTNRPPVFVAASPEEKSIALVGRPVVFSAEALDPDGDVITYKWRYGFLEGVNGYSSIKRTFTSLGYKEIYVTASDGRDSAEHIFYVRAGRLKPEGQ